MQSDWLIVKTLAHFQKLKPLAFVVGLGLLASCASRNQDVSQDADRTGGSRNIFGGQASIWPGVGALLVGDHPSCTAVEIGPRCLLTSGHCVNNFRPNIYVQAENVFKRTEEIINIRKTERPNNNNNPLADLAVVWTADKACPTGLRGSNNCTINPTWTKRAIANPPPKNALYKFYGYGMLNDNIANGAGEKRWGQMKLSEVTNGPDYTSPPPGSITAINGQMLTFAANPTQHSCIGDSGGPFINSSNMVIGITSAGTLGCNKLSTVTLATGFQGWNGRWVKDKITNYCRPALQVGVTIWKVGYDGRKQDDNVGKVEEDIAKIPKRINCGNGGTDCEEVSDPLNPKKYFASMVLKAIPAGTNTFNHWENVVPGSCPCHEQTTPKCKIGPAFINYDVVLPEQMESADCKAIFYDPTLPTIH